MKKLLVAGPCVIERDGSWLTEVGALIKQRLPFTGYEWILKSSFRKGNRTRGDSFEGISTKAALTALTRAGDYLGVQVCTDVHCEDDIYLAVYAGVDVIQIPERMCRDTSMLRTAAKIAPGAVLLKCGLSMSPAKYGAAIKKLDGAKRIIGCYRGTAFGDEVIFDIGRLVEMAPYAELIADVTHSTQVLGDVETRARRSRSGYYARAAAATGDIDGIFAEVHPEPENALSDADSQLSIPDFAAMLERLKWA